MTEFSVSMPLKVIGNFFDRLQNYMKNKNNGNQNKKILEDFNWTMDKMDRDGENKTLRIYRCRSNYALSKVIVDNGLKDLWRRVIELYSYRGL